MKTVVFGGSGFLGSHVADALLEKGHHVTVYDIHTSTYLQRNQQMIVGDILDQNKVRDVIAGADYVYHFAGIAGLQDAQDNPIETVKYNILGTTYLLDACREHKVKRFLYASTIYVYGDHGSFYRSSKQASELIIENYKQIYDLNYSILRYGSLYGKRANEFNFINTIIKQALVEKKIHRDGDGNEVRDYINVLDAAKASVNVLNDDYKNQYVMITGNQTIRVRDLLEMIKEILNNEIVVEYSKHREEAHYEITPYNFKPRVAKKHVLSDYYDLGQGILDCIHDVYDQLNSNNKNKNLKEQFPSLVKH